ncbi:GAF domain-containing protein [Cupriavidus plantarum]|uniref:Excisionase family DNA binding protein n=2 Tax=Cupriavidus plantarum TaxID=942865 RepID=A0A316ERX4_9BURK|nr:GAF domain-containing protein [Cupriavidus plantarum]PWK34289.1 excisionase family DNA binding protein [Cupriavidus plantarum]
MEDTVLTTTQVARMLGISVRTAQLLIEGGTLTSWKTPGGHRRVFRAEVQALIARERPALTPETPAGETTSAVDAEGAYPVAADEARRLLAVERSGLVDTAPETAYDRITWLAAQTLSAPVALMTVLTPTRQWFKSRHGLEMSESPRSWAFCNHTVLQREVFVVNDLSTHLAFASNPAVAGAPHFRFYAGAPVRDPEGYALGSICVMDYAPRWLDADQKKALEALAAFASSEIRLAQTDRALVQLQDHRARKARAAR